MLFHRTSNSAAISNFLFGLEFLKIVQFPVGKSRFCAALVFFLKFNPRKRTNKCTIIFTGVSNWGCYGLGVALYALRSCPIHDRYIRRAIGFPINASEQMRNYLPTVARVSFVMRFLS